MADPSDRDYVSELDALDDPPPWERNAPAEPEVGTSDTARELHSQGVFEHLRAQHARERQADKQKAIEDSQGWSVGGLTRAVGDFLGSARERTQTGVMAPLSAPGDPSPEKSNGLLGSFGELGPDERQQAAQAELQTRQSTAPFFKGLADQFPEDLSPTAAKARTEAARAKFTRGDTQGAVRDLVSDLGMRTLAGGVARGLLNAEAETQERALRHAQAMVRGEVEQPRFSQLRTALDNAGKTAADLFYTGWYVTAGAYADIAGIKDNAILQYGRDVGKVVEKMFPGDRARQFEFTQQLVNGAVSTGVFAGQNVLGQMLGLGPKGVYALIALTGAVGQTPDEFERVTKALKEGKATERDVLLNTLAASALGATEAFPFVTDWTGGRAGLAGRMLKGAEQSVEEMIQEGPVQTLGQNLVRQQTYEPDQDPYEGVLSNMLVAGVTGGMYGGALHSPDEARAGNAMGTWAGVGFKREKFV